MATKSYLIPVGDLSLEDRRGLRANADTKITQNALDVRIRTNDNDLIIRDTLPNTDFGVGVGGPAAGAGTDESWLDQIIGVAGAEHQYFGAALANDRVVGFFGLGEESAPASISRVRLTLGAASAQIRGVFQLEPLYSRLETAGFFSEVVVFAPNEFVRVMVMCRLAYAILTERLHFYARTIEPIGAVVSAPSV